MNILVVHEVDWLKKVAFEIHNISEQMSVLGHKVFAIDYEDTWQRNGIINLGSLRTREFDSVSRTIPGASVCLRRPGFIRIPGLSRLSAGITHYLEIKKVIREKNIDVVLLYSVPTNGLQTIYLARKFGIPVVFRSIDILNRMVRYPALRSVTRFLEKRVYSTVDMILTITPKLSSYVVKMGAREARVKLLLIPVDTNLFHPSIDSAEIRQRWSLGENDRIIAFIGTLFGFSGLDAFIYKFPGVLAQIPEAKLLIVGDGPQRLKLEGIIAELGLQNNVIITGFQPYQMMPQYINLATVCINPFLEVDATRDIFPSKIVQYLACGRTVLATPLPGMLAVISGEQQGVIYTDSADAMAGEIVALLKSDERRQRLERAGLNYARQTHSNEKIARQLEVELESVIKEKQGMKLS